MEVVDIFEAAEELTAIELPLYTCPVRAGFPSPADDYVDLRLDLNELLIKRPSSTFFVRVAGDSMINAGIMDGAILTVDRSLAPDEGKIVIAVVNGECTVKRIRYQAERICLEPANAAYAPIYVTLGEQFDIWGVVTHAINPMF